MQNKTGMNLTNCPWCTSSHTVTSMVHYSFTLQAFFRNMQSFIKLKSKLHFLVSNGKYILMMIHFIFISTPGKIKRKYFILTCYKMKRSSKFLGKRNNWQSHSDFYYFLPSEYILVHRSGGPSCFSQASSLSH